MVNSNTWSLTAEVYKTFLFCAARIVRAEAAKAAKDGSSDEDHRSLPASAEGGYGLLPDVEAVKQGRPSPMQ